MSANCASCGHDPGSHPRNAAGLRPCSCGKCPNFVADVRGD